MTSEEYWHGPVRLAESYREAYRIKQESDNYDMWMQGLYIYEALSIVSYNENRGKKRAINYPEKPHRITPMTEEEKKIEAEKERQKVINQFNSYKKAWEMKNAK